MRTNKQRKRQQPEERDALRAERRLGNAVPLTQDGQGYPACADPGRCVDWGER